jgi:hypothetical protein
LLLQLPLLQLPLLLLLLLLLPLLLLLLLCQRVHHREAEQLLLLEGL